MDSPAAAVVPPNPLTSIWTRPRETIRYLVEADPKRHVLQLAMAGGAGQSLSQAMQSGVGDRMELPAIIFLVSIVGSLYGLAALYIGSALLQWTGRWIGGRGERSHLRTAIAWSNVPQVVILLISGFVVTLTGRLPFLSEEAMQQVDIGMGDALVMMLYGLSIFVLAIWSFIILLKSIGEVQGFSAWKAWGNLILCLLPVLVIGVLAAVLLPMFA